MARTCCWQGDAVLSARRDVLAAGEACVCQVEARAGAQAKALASEPASDAARRWSIFSLLALLFLIIAVSNLAVDTADWIDRAMMDSE